MKMLTNARTLVALLVLFLSITPAPSAETATWTFYNNTRIVIDEIHIIPTGRSNWGGDWLRGNGLRSGYRQAFNVNIGVYDVQLVTEDGLVCEYRRQSHTQVHTWTIQASWFNNRNACKQE